MEPKPAVTLKERPFRSVLKALSWRFAATLDTIVISWFVTGNLKLAFSIGSIEVVTKMALYYMHERAWSKSKLGLVDTTNRDDQI